MPVPIPDIKALEGVVETTTPSNSRERPRPPVSESADSRSTSLGMLESPAPRLDTQALDELLFGAVYSLTRGAQQGGSTEATHKLSQLVSMASQLRVANPKTANGAQRELQEHCQRLVNRLPTVLSDTLSSGSEEASSQLGQSLSPLSTSRASRLSLDSRLGAAPSRVLLRRQQQPPASSSQQSGGSRRREAANPFDVARSEDGTSVEVIEEEEFLVEEVTTPGGTVREVVVRESSSESQDMHASFVAARTRSEELADQSALAGSAALDAEQSQFRVASPKDAEPRPGSNPFAAARSVAAILAAQIVRPAGGVRRQGSLGMAREDLLSRVGDAPSLASVADQGTVFLDSLESPEGSGAAKAEPGSAAEPRAAPDSPFAQLPIFSPARAQTGAAQKGSAVELKDVGRRVSWDIKQSLEESVSDSKERKHKHKGDSSRKPPRGSSEKTPSSEIAEMVKKRGTERNQERDARNDTRNYAEAAQKLKSRASSSSNAQIKKAGAGPPLIASLRIRNDFGDFNPFKNKKGWEINFCTCPTTAVMDLGDINSLTYPTFYEAAEELSRQATLRAAGAQQHPRAAKRADFRNDPMAPADSGASALDNAFLSLTSGAGSGTMYSEFVPRCTHEEVFTPSASALPVVRRSELDLGGSSGSRPSQALPKVQSSSSNRTSEARQDKAQGCGCWPFGR
ncbi:g2570 [Coccomyxa elongata]